MEDRTEDRIEWLPHSPTEARPSQRGFTGRSTRCVAGCFTDVSPRRKQRLSGPYRGKPEGSILPTADATSCLPCPLQQCTRRQTPDIALQSRLPHMAITCQSHANHMPITYQSQPNHSPIACQSHANRMPITWYRIAKLAASLPRALRNKFTARQHRGSALGSPGDP